MKSLSFINLLSLAFSALVGLVLIWGLLTVFAFSLVFVLPVLVIAGAVWVGYVWWKLRKLTGSTTSRTTTIDGESREIEIVSMTLEQTKPINPTSPQKD